jgi:streptomycin 6-kinase
VIVERAFDTPSSVIAYGRRGADSVVLKVIKQPGDEWRAGEVTRAFQGRGMVRALEVVPGAALLERLAPATPLVHVVRRGDDDGATAILCDVIEAMSPSAMATPCPTVRDWGRGFDRYDASTDGRIPRDLAATGQREFLELCDSQRNPRLLHGDLHHYNVVRDRLRGWVAIDPKGVVGELEYEIGAALRNPTERPDLLAASTIARRVTLFTSRLKLDAVRILRWAFAQAILSAIWSVEDGEDVDSTNPAVVLATTLRPMLDDSR